MWNQFSDVAPKAAVSAAALWAGACYLLIGPEVAVRVVSADHLPACEAGYRTAAIEAAEQRAASIARPTIDVGKEMAAAQLRDLQANPVMQELNRSGLGAIMGFDQTFAMVGAQYEQQKRAVVDAYEQAMERVREETATELGKAGSACGQAADIAIAETRGDWAIFAGTLGLIRPAPLKSFDDRIKRTLAANRLLPGEDGTR